MPAPLCAQEASLPCFSSDSPWLQRDLALGRETVALEGRGWGSGSSTIILLGTRGSASCLRGGGQGRLLGGGGLRLSVGTRGGWKALGQGQAEGGGQVMFPAHTQASWPPAPGLLISRNRSHVWQVGAVGKVGVFIAPLIS